MWKLLVRRFDWLDPQHPIALRDAKHKPHNLPRFVLRLTDMRTLVGYAAMVHGILFVMALVFYNRLHDVLPGLLVPFLTPFGTPLVVAALHSILYWVMLIGICNYTTYFIASDLESGTWTQLRATPYSTTQVLLAKMVAAGRLWLGVLRVLLLTRLVASIAIPIAVLLDPHESLGYDAFNIIFFVIQPISDAIVVASLSTLSSFLIRNITWARIGAYGLSAMVIGFFSGISSLWLVFTSPMGVVAGLLVPLNQWSFFATALTPLHSLPGHAVQLVILIGTQVIGPLMIAYFAFRWALRLARDETRSSADLPEIQPRRRIRRAAP